ncbi:MAG TPA: RsbRD N-terminal domain-containing protein [Thermodesulfobacteriota bacterium]|nr:RsbRD N-terminal domain-containing protein [Thermodesulfobacteriota bacterium]
MNLETLIAEKKSAILGRWFDLAIASYPAETASFLKSKKNRFANPVGFILSQELTPILDGLLQGVEVQTLKPFLDNIIRIRAVQDFAPSRALKFVFSLKETIRQELEKEIRENRLEQQLLILESRIDVLSLLAFDLFVQCREKIYDLKANEMKNRTVRLLKRAKLVEEDLLEPLPGSDS